MSTMSNILLDKEILLESGTNELEVLVFDVADYTFGINVAKVREVLPTTQITTLPRAHSSIRGVFKLRDNVIPTVSLLDHLGIESTRENSESNTILTDFNQQQTAFLVDDVERIHRLSWENILAVPGLEALAQTPVTALARCDDRLIVMLDFEMILDDVTDQFFRTDAVENPLGLPREKLKIILAEDSPTVREAIGNTLRNSGYTDLVFFDNGAEAWQWISDRVQQTGHNEDVCDLVISDVEMPQVDGFHLTKRIKEHSELRQLPVLLYSSIITPDNHKKGQAVGADAQVSKPEMDKVVQLADELISTAQRENRAAALREVTESGPAADLMSGAAEPSVSSEPSGPASAPLSAEPVASVEPTRPQDVPGAPSRERSVSETDTSGLADTQQKSSATIPTDQLAEIPPPTGVDAKLWNTFQNELLGRTIDLHNVLNRTAEGDREENTLREIARILHTVKSASMVIPLEQITRCTHKAESLLDLARENSDQWPQDALERYVMWLDSILAPSGTIDDTLDRGFEIETTLTQ